MNGLVIKARMRNLKDRLLLSRAWCLIEEQTERSVDGVGLLPWRPHDAWSALAAVAPDFGCYCRLYNQMAKSAYALRGAESLAQMVELPSSQLREVFQHAIAMDDET